MKKRKIAKAAVAVLSVLTIGAAGAAITACDGCDDHTHSYGDWTILDTNKPTFTDGGLAERFCEADDGGVQTMVLPNLSDTSFWKEGEKVDPTCTAEGSRTFTSDYGTVTVPVAKDPDAHIGGTWTISVDPTDSAKGKATHNCGAEVDIPALSDKTVWTEKTSEYVAPTHSTDGKRVYSSVYGDVTIVLKADATAHTYGDWTFVEGKIPTQNDAGEIQRVCSENNEHIETQPVPALIDTDFWHYTIVTPPSHQAVGVANYSNDDYGIELKDVQLSKIAHTFGSWEITTQPTETNKGVATRTCTLASCAEDETATETFALPALSDTSFWSKTEFEADYVRPAGVTYSNATYGSFTVYTGVKLPAPYDNNTYSSVNVSVNDANGNALISNSWTKAMLTVGDDSIGYGTGYPFFGKFILELIDPETGLVLVTRYSLDSSSDSGYSDTPEAPYYAYVDSETGILVLQNSNSWSEVTVAIPTETEVVRSDYKASALAGDFIISYRDVHILVAEFDGVYFGVSVTDIYGDALTAENCLENVSGAIIVKDNSGKTLKAYALNAKDEWVVSDGLEGVYTLPDDRKVVVNGASIVTVNGVKSIYEIVSNTDDSKIISVIVNNDYYEYTLSGDGTCTEAAPKVTLTYNLNGETITNDISLENEISKHLPLVLAVPEHATKQFIGWYTDADCENPVTLVDGKYVPDGDAVLYAKWAARVTLHLNNLLDGDENYATFYVGDGENLSSKLTMYTKLESFNADGSKYFDGWYLDAEFATGLAESAIVYEDDDGLVLYAKWTDVNAMYGTYDGKQLLSGGVVKEAHIEVTVDGTITGYVNETAINGKVYYDAGNDKYTWRSDNKDYAIWFDAENGLIVIPEDFAYTTMDKFPFLLAKDGEVGNVESFDFTLNKTKLVQYGDNITLIYGDKIYGNVNISNAFGDALNIDNVQSSKTLVVKQDGKTVLAIGTTAAYFGTVKDEFGSMATVSALDAYYGVYNIGGVDYALDGVGNISWNDGTAHSGIYSYVKADVNGAVFDVFERERKENSSTSEDSDGDTVTSVTVTYKNIAYYELHLGDTNSITMPTATVNFVSTQTAVNPVNVNIKVAVTLDALDDTETHVFRGWYANADFSGDAITEITLETTDGKTYYAKWLEKVILSVDYNDGEDGASRVVDYVYGKGETVKLDTPIREGYKLVGWFTDADLNNEWTDTTISADLHLYASWTEAQIYMFVNYGIMYVSEDSGSGTDSVDFRSGTITFNPDNTAQSSSWPFNGYETTVTDFDKQNGKMLIDTKSSQVGIGTHKAFIDMDTGLIVLNYTAGEDSDFGRLFILIPNTTSSSGMNYGESFWNNGKTRAISFTWNSALYTIFVNGKQVYFNVSFENAAGDSVAANVAYQSTTLYVKNADGDLIAKFGYDGENMNELDGYEDIIFTGASGNLTVNGVATITLGGVEGTYSINKESGAAYTADAYIDGSYYEVTLDKVAKTYTIVKRMVTVTYVTEYDASNAVSGLYNKNIAITLPVLTDSTNVFRGWYIDDDSVLLSGEYIPTADVTITAKWDIKVTLTVVYGNGLDPVVLEYGAGDIIAPEKPEYTNGKVFEGWYSDVDCTVPYIDETISANTTIYCKWQESVAMYGDYYGWNLYGKDSKTISATTTSSTKLLIAANGDVTGTKTGSVVNNPAYDPETGIFYIQGSSTYYLVYDAASGAVGVAYSSSSTSFGEDMYLLFNKFIKSGENSVTLGEGGNLTGGKLVSVTFADDTTVNLFVTNTRIYSGVTWVATNSLGEVAQYTAKEVVNASTITVYDSNGDVIIVRGNDNGTWKDLDGMQGTYTNGNDSFALNGVGGIVWGGKSGTYTAAPEGAGYTCDVKFSGEYYQVTITGNNFTAVKPETVITFDLGGKGDNFTINQNLKIELTLSTIEEPTAEGFVFKGWYSGEGGTGSRVYYFTPTSTDPQTIYAKWVAVYTVTLVYNDGSDNNVNTYEEGATVSLSDKKPEALQLDGQLFVGWYAEPEFVTPVTSVTVDGNKSVYAKWAAIDLTAITINAVATNNNASYGFDVDNGLYTSTNQDVNSSQSRMTITANEAGMLMLQYQSSGETNYDYLYININGTQVATAKGIANTSDYSVGDPPKDGKWIDFNAYLNEGDVVEIIFVKDGSSKSGADTGWVKDILFAIG